MNNIADVQNTYSKIIGAVVALVGVLGFFMNPILGLLSVNMASNIVHLVGGLLVIWKSGKTTNLVVGVIALIVGVIGFIPGISVVAEGWLGFNTNFHILHIVIGVVSLAVAKLAK